MAETEAPVPEARAPVALKDSKTHTHTHREEHTNRSVETCKCKNIRFKNVISKTKIESDKC